MKRITLALTLVALFVLMAIVQTAAAQTRGEPPPVAPVTCPHCPPSMVFWIAMPFHSFAPAVADYAEAPAGSVAPLATGDADYPFVVLHRVVGDFVAQPGPYWTSEVTSCAPGMRVVTAPNGPTVALFRAP